MSLLSKNIQASSKFSEFIRNASSREKKRVYAKVLQDASRAQLEIINRAKAMSAARENKQSAGFTEIAD